MRAGQGTRHRVAMGILAAIFAPRTLSREQLCNDQINTGVTAALIGGFALSNVQAGFSIDNLDEEAYGAQLAIYLMSFVSVHACTCSALMSCIIYSVINKLDEDAVCNWGRAHPMMITVPLIKFGMGCAFYIFSILVIAWKDLEGSMAAQVAAMVVGGVVTLITRITCNNLLCWESWMERTLITLITLITLANDPNNSNRASRRSSSLSSYL